MSLNAYQQVQNVSKAAPQDNEHRLFMEVTKSLIQVQSKNDRGPALFKALDWNRRLWSTLSTDCAIEGNGLPKELRAGIVSLGLWVSKYTSQVARGQEDIEALIGINKTIMEGLDDQRKRMASEQKEAALQTPQAPQAPQAPQTTNPDQDQPNGPTTNIDA